MSADVKTLITKLRAEWEALRNHPHLQERGTVETDPLMYAICGTLYALEQAIERDEDTKIDKLMKEFERLQGVVSQLAESHPEL